jgi:IS5 family transposase
MTGLPTAGPPDLGGPSDSISHLKRSFGVRRTRLRRLGGARIWVGLGIFAYNLQRMTVVAE